MTKQELIEQIEYIIENWWDLYFDKGYIGVLSYQGACEDILKLVQQLD